MQTLPPSEEWAECTDPADLSCGGAAKGSCEIESFTPAPSESDHAAPESNAWSLTGSAWAKLPLPSGAAAFLELASRILYMSAGRSPAPTRIPARHTLEAIRSLYSEVGVVTSFDTC